MKIFAIFVATVSFAFGQGNSVNGKGDGITDPAAFRGKLLAASEADLGAETAAREAADSGLATDIAAVQASAAPAQPAEILFETNYATIPSTAIGSFVRLGANVQAMLLPSSTSADTRKSITLFSATGNVDVYNPAFSFIGRLRAGIAQRYQLTGTSTWSAVGLQTNMVESIINGLATLTGLKTFTTSPRSTGTPDSPLSILNRAQADLRHLSIHNTIPVFMAAMSTIAGSGGVAAYANKRGVWEFYTGVTLNGYAGIWCQLNWVADTISSYGVSWDVVVPRNAFRNAETNNRTYLQMGRNVSGNDPIGKIGAKGLGMEVNALGQVTAYVHNGTTMTNGTTGNIPSGTTNMILRWQAGVGLSVFAAKADGSLTLVSLVTTGLPTGSLGQAQLEVLTQNLGPAASSLGQSINFLPSMYVILR